MAIEQERLLLAGSKPASDRHFRDLLVRSLARLGVSAPVCFSESNILRVLHESISTLLPGSAADCHILSPVSSAWRGAATLGVARCPDVTTTSHNCRSQFSTIHPILERTNSDTLLAPRAAETARRCSYSSSDTRNVTSLVRACITGIEATSRVRVKSLPIRD